MAEYKGSKRVVTIQNEDGTFPFASLVGEYKGSFDVVTVQDVNGNFVYFSNLGGGTGGEVVSSFGLNINGTSSDTRGDHFTFSQNDVWEAIPVTYNNVFNLNNKNVALDLVTPDGDGKTLTIKNIDTFINYIKLGGLIFPIESQWQNTTFRIVAFNSSVPQSEMLKDVEDISSTYDGQYLITAQNSIIATNGKRATNINGVDLWLLENLDTSQVSRNGWKIQLQGITNGAANERIYNDESFLTLDFHYLDKSQNNFNDFYRYTQYQNDKLIEDDVVVGNPLTTLPLVNQVETEVLKIDKSKIIDGHLYRIFGNMVYTRLGGGENTQSFIRVRIKQGSMIVVDANIAVWRDQTAFLNIPQIAKRYVLNNQEDLIVTAENLSGVASNISISVSQRTLSIE